MFVAALGTDPLASALDAWSALESYRVTMRSALADGETQTVRYHYRKPGYVRMEFVHPHRGALLVYDPVRRKASLRPFGDGVFPKLSLSPGNPLIRSPGGHTVDRSDVGVLLANARKLQRTGAIEIVGEESIGRLRTVHLRVTGNGRRAVDGVHRYDLWLERASLFPVKAESRDDTGALVESVSMDDVETGVAFPDGFFDG